MNEIETEREPFGNTQFELGSNQVKTKIIYRLRLLLSYFCMTNIAGFTSKNKDKIIYPDIPLAIKPIKHDANFPVPDPPITLPSKTDS